MTNSYDREKQRLRRYGEMLKEDIEDHKVTSKQKRQELTKQQNLQLQHHIENTKRYYKERQAELKNINKSLIDDNLMLSTFKKTMQSPHIYAEEGTNFIQGIYQMNNQRLQNYKKQLNHQVLQNNHHSSNRKMLEERIQEIEKIENERHKERMKEWQTNSKKNYQETKKKHQQNMELYDRHRKLMQENEHYKQKLEEFTHSNQGVLSPFQRNQYLKRRAQQMQNQNEIKRQMQDFERKKSQDNCDYKKSFGDLQQSMLRSVLVRPQRYDAKAVSQQLKGQMKEADRKRREQENAKKQKYEITNFYGGVHGAEREKMMKYIDKTLGLDSYEAKSKLNSSMNLPYVNYNSSRTQNPELPIHERSKSTTPKSIHNSECLDFPKDSNSSSLYRSPSIHRQRNMPKTFRSYNVVTGTDKIYNYD